MDNPPNEYHNRNLQVCYFSAASTKATSLGNEPIHGGSAKKSVVYKGRL